MKSESFDFVNGVCVIRQGGTLKTFANNNHNNDHLCSKLRWSGIGVIMHNKISDFYLIYIKNIFQ